MKTTLPTQATITNLLAVLLLILLPALATASSDHLRDQFSGGQCSKEQCDNSLSVPLYINGGKRVGKVTVRLQKSDLKVTYQVKDGWAIKETSLDVADSYNGLHVNADGSPQVKNFPYKAKHFTPVKSAEYTLSAGQWPLGTQLYLSAQAIVVSEKGSLCQYHSATTGHHRKNREFTFHREDDHEYDKEHGKHKHHHKGSYRERRGHDRSSDDADHGKSFSGDAWAVGERFPGQKQAAYFTYTLKSCSSELSVIQFSDAVYTVNEGDPQVLITVTRSGNLEDAASVDFTTVDGTAQNGVDYVFTNGVLNFAPGQTSAQFAVTPIDDTMVEDVETVVLQLSNPVNASLGQQNTATLEIEDNDVAPATTIQFQQAKYTYLEHIAIAVITVSRSGDLSAESQVDFATVDGTATANSDYIANSGTLVFPAGVDTITFQVRIINDRLVEPDETVLLQLSNPKGAALGTQSDATLIIQNDDGLPT